MLAGAHGTEQSRGQERFRAGRTVNGNPDAADRLKKMLHAVFPGAQVDVSPCGGLCSYYAELGGLMVGYEDNEAPAL